MANILTSQIQIPSLPNDILILKDAEARQDLSTALATATGNPLNFSTRSAQKANETVISLEPIQDLHGYDYPWPAGGGKNILPMTVDGIKAANTSGTWTGNAYTLNGVTFTIQTYAGNNVTGILINGNSTSVTVLILNPSFLLKSDSYILNGAPASSGVETWRWQVNLGQQFNIDSGNGNSFTVPEDFPNALSFIRVGQGLNLQNVLFQPMLRLATETDPTFAPYSNICPIDGHTEVSVKGCGKNLFDKNAIDITNNCYLLVNGTLSGYNAEWAISGYIKASEYVTLSNFANGSYNNPSVCWFDENKTYLGGINYANTSPFTFLMPSNAVYFRFSYKKAEEQVQAELGSTATSYEPYTPSNDLTIQFGEKVYGGTVDLESGTVTVEWGYIASYNGETLPGEWISDRDVYAPNTSPSTGAEVAYELATPTTIQLTPNEISLLEGVNVISSNADGISLTYRDGKVATLGDLKKLKDIVNDTYSPSYRGKNVVHMGDSWVELYNIAELASEFVGYRVTNVGFQASAITNVYDGTPVSDADKFSLIKLAHALETNVWTEQDTAAVGKSWAGQLAKLKAIDWLKVDVLILSYGINDFNYQSIIGDHDARDEESVCGALKTAIGILENLNPYMEIVVTTPCFRYMSPNGENMTNFGTRILLEEYRNGIGLTAKECGIKLVDMGAISGINEDNRSLTLLSDGLHPTELGQALWADAFAKSLECGYAGAFDINVFNVMKDADNLCEDNEQYSKHQKWNSSFVSNKVKYLCIRADQQYKNMVLGQAFYTSLPTGSVLRMTGIGKKIGTQNHRVDIYVYNSDKSTKLLEKTSGAIKHTTDTAFDHSWTTEEDYTNCWVIFAVKQMSAWADGKALVRDVKCTVTLPDKGAIVDDTTGVKYKLGMNNGLLYIEEV